MPAYVRQASPLIKGQLGVEGTVHTCGAAAAGDGSGNETDLGGSGSVVSEEATSGSCIDELTLLLASIFMVQLVRGQFQGCGLRAYQTFGLKVPCVRGSSLAMPRSIWYQG